MNSFLLRPIKFLDVIEALNPIPLIPVIRVDLGETVVGSSLPLSPHLI